MFNILTKHYAQLVLTFIFTYLLLLGSVANSAWIAAPSVILLCLLVFILVCTTALLLWKPKDVVDHATHSPVWKAWVSIFGWKGSFVAGVAQSIVIMLIYTVLLPSVPFKAVLLILIGLASATTHYSLITRHFHNETTES